MAKIKISEGLGWLKTLEARHKELKELRGENAHKEDRYYGSAGKEVNRTPVYNVSKLDSLLTRVSKEIRKVSEAIKTANATTEVPNYDMDESVLGELEMDGAVLKLIPDRKVLNLAEEPDLKK